ncbi:MAG: J domain-containing protein [Bacteroidota bacterium]
MAQATDYYQLLGVDEAASASAIKRAYRVLARQSHPDHNPDDAHAEDRFKRIQAAYQILSDPERRQTYDALRRDPLAMAFRAAGAFASSGITDPLSPSFFGPDAPGPGADIEAQIRLTFDQALRGGTTEVRLGDGQTVRLTVPKGVRSGLKVRVRGRGKASASGERGDLYVTYRVDPSPRFRREGDNLHVVETVSAIEAVLGAARSITNAYGQTVKVAVPPGTQPGERLRLRGQGVATPKRAGDLFVEVQVTVPRDLSDAQREALRTTAEDIGLL